MVVTMHTYPSCWCCYSSPSASHTSTVPPSTSRFPTIDQRGQQLVQQLCWFMIICGGSFVFFYIFRVSQLVKLYILNHHRSSNQQAAFFSYGSSITKGCAAPAIPSQKKARLADRSRRGCPADDGGRSWPWYWRVVGIPEWWYMATEATKVLLAMLDNQSQAMINIIHQSQWFF